MKRFLLLYIFILTGFVSCEDTDEKQEQQFEVTNFTHSDCKQDANRKENANEYIVFKANGTNTLFVKHFNIIFNCCPGKLKVEATIKEDTIHIFFDETEHGCKCLCPYDFSYQLGKLDYRKYTVVLHKPDKNYFKFNLDFTANTEGKVEVK